MSRARALTLALAGCALVLCVSSAPSRAQEPTEDLQQLVAPVALYPDQLLANVLAASTYPSQVDDAARWLQQNATLSSDQIARAVDGMDWDSSVKALTEFPMVLANMDQNLSWTSALGDAYYNEPDAVVDAVQQLREEALAAGTLQSNAQITVSRQDGIVVIQPASATVVYVPSYDCWTVYGRPIRPLPGFYVVAGLGGGPRVAWDLSFRLGGVWTRVNWGWRNWTFDWTRRRVTFHREEWISRSPTMVDRRPSYRGPAEAGRRPLPPPPEQRPQQRQQPPAGRRGIEPRPGEGPRGPVAQPREQQPVAPPKPAATPPAPANPRRDRGFPQAEPTTPPAGTRTGALSGYNPGGTVTNNSQRGRESLGHAGRGSGPPPQRQAAPPSRQTPPPAKRKDEGRGRGKGGV